MAANIPRYRIALDFKSLDDGARVSLVTGIEKVALTASLGQIPSIKTSLTALNAKVTALTAGNAAVAADHKLLQQDTGVRDVARGALDAELDTLRALVTNNAQSASDVTAMGFTLRASPPATRTKPDAPTQLLVRFEKKPGRARVSVAEPPSAPKGNFVAESSPDPIAATTWSPMPGNGKQRLVTGGSGAKVWVRFAQVRYGLQSDWSTPVLVTFP
jgi:hypothetical protein